MRVRYLLRSIQRTLKTGRTKKCTRVAGRAYIFNGYTFGRNRCDFKRSSDKMKPRRARISKTILVVIGCVIALPVIIPYVLIANAFDDRRRVRDADNFCCTQCGNIVGRASIAKANEYWQQHVRELQNRFPGARFRLIRDVWAICTECGAKYNYSTKDKTYILKPNDNDASMVSCGERMYTNFWHGDQRNR